MDSGIPYELRTTVVSPLHDENAFLEIANTLLPITLEKKARIPRYFLQPFVDRPTVAFSGLSAPDRAQLERFRALLLSVADEVAIRG